MPPLSRGDPYCKAGIKKRISEAVTYGSKRTTEEDISYIAELTLDIFDVKGLIRPDNLLHLVP